RLLLATLSAGRGGSRFLSRSDRVCGALVSLCRSGSRPLFLHGGAARIAFLRLARVRIGGAFELAGAERVALALHYRRNSGDSFRGDHVLLSYRPTPASQLATC